MTIWSPAAFVKDPAGWLRDFLDRGCTVSPSPNFGYETLVAAVGADEVATLDMSRWRVALNGAEPVRPTTVERFCAHFAPAGFAPTAMFPVYGMAEATLAVTFPPLGRATQTTWVDRERLAADGLAVTAAPGDLGARGLVALGRPVRGMRLRVVDDRGVALPDNLVGEVEIRGESVTAGYLSRDPGTTGLVNSDGWLRTGDLGFLRDGELHVSGRRKEMIIVRGVNYYPEDAEAAAREVPGLHRQRVVAVADDGEHGEHSENITIIAETAFESPADRDRLAADLRLAVVTALGLREVTVHLVTPDALPRTSSGKFQRLAAARDLALTRRKP
jgi:acyl-CoA synthetase (AMP-forming)/AMP-acid ligase II